MLRVSRVFNPFRENARREGNVHINHFAVVAAALATFAIGGLWYSPVLFHRAWMKASGLTEQDLKAGMVKIFGLSFLFSMIMAYNLAAFLAGPDTTVWWGATAGRVSCGLCGALVVLGVLLF